MVWCEGVPAEGDMVRAFWAISCKGYTHNGVVACLCSYECACGAGRGHKQP